MTSHAAWRGLPPRSRRVWTRWLSIIYAPSSTGRVRRKACCEPFGGSLIQALQPSTISRPRLLLHGCQWAARALSTGGHPSDLLTGHKRDQRFDESGPTNRELDGWAEPGRPSGYLYYHSRRSALGATLVSRDNDFKSIDGLPIVAWRSSQVPLCKAYVRGDDDTLI